MDSRARCAAPGSQERGNFVARISLSSPRGVERPRGLREGWRCPAPDYRPWLRTDFIDRRRIEVQDAGINGPVRSTHAITIPAAVRLRKVFTNESVKPPAAGKPSQANTIAYPASVTPTNCTTLTTRVMTSNTRASGTETAMPMDLTVQ